MHSLCVYVPLLDDSSPTLSVATFKMDASAVYKAICDTMRDDQVTLLLYLLLHRNQFFKSFVLSRTNIDQLVRELCVSS